MDELELRKSLAKESDTKIVLFVIDGVGGLPGPSGLTELQAARTPHLDHLAQRAACGLHDPVAPGITPGSGPGHLGLFGYEPTECGKSEPNISRSKGRCSYIWIARGSRMMPK